VHGIKHHDGAPHSNVLHWELFKGHVHAFRLQAWDGVCKHRCKGLHKASAGVPVDGVVCTFDGDLQEEWQVEDGT
jgi:hypothetical protein